MSLNDKAAAALKREIRRAFPERAANDPGHDRLAAALSKPTHTPGPWRISHECGDPAWSMVLTGDGNVVANVNGETGPDIPPLVSTKMPMHANARLIAAAPCMYSALLQIATYDPTKLDAATLGNIARAAIAKAEGGAK